MNVTISELAGVGTKVTLVGKLDIAGAEVIGLPLATVAGQTANVMIDMSGVDFIASIGIRHLVMAAKALSRRSGRLVLVAPNQFVAEVLMTSGLESILPIVHSEAEAVAALAARS